MVHAQAWFKFRCPHCNAKHAVPKTVVGKVVRCEKCDNTVHVTATPADASPNLPISQRVLELPPTPLLPGEVTREQLAEGSGYIFPPID